MTLPVQNMWQQDAQLSTVSAYLPFVAPLSMCFTRLYNSSSFFTEITEGQYLESQNSTDQLTSFLRFHPFLCLFLPSVLFLPVCYIFHRFKIQKIKNGIQDNSILSHGSVSFPENSRVVLVYPSTELFYDM